MLTLRIVTLTLTLVVASAIGVAGQDEEDSPHTSASFTAEAGAPAEDSGDVETRPLYLRDVPVEATDPRASGLFSIAWNHGGVTDNLTLHGVTYGVGRLVNDGGAWAGMGTVIRSDEPEERTKKQKKQGMGKPPLDASTALWELTGEGDYVGLSMFLSTDEKWWGIIVPTDTLPTVPEPPAE